MAVEVRGGKNMGIRDPQALHEPDPVVSRASFARLGRESFVRRASHLRVKSARALQGGGGRAERDTNDEGAAV